MFNFALEMKIKNGSKVVKTSLTTLNAFEIVLMACIMLLALSSFFIKGEFSWQNCIAAISAVLGVFCVVLGAKGSLANWIFGMFEGFLHIVICFYTHMYGDFLQRIFWNLPMQFVGWKSWRKRELSDHTNRVKTRYMTWKQRGLTFLIVAVMTVLLGIFLKSFGPWMIDTLHGILPDMQFKTLKMDYDQEAQLWLDRHYGKIMGEDVRKYTFYKAAVITCDAAMILARRYGDACKAKADECEDPKRKAELTTMAENLYWLEEHPARTFWQAVQDYSDCYAREHHDEIEITSGANKIIYRYKQ